MMRTHTHTLYQITCNGARPPRMIYNPAPALGWGGRWREAAEPKLRERLLTTD